MAPATWLTPNITKYLLHICTSKSIKNLFTGQMEELVVTQEEKGAGKAKSGDGRFVVQCRQLKNMAGCSLIGLCVCAPDLIHGKESEEHGRGEQAD